MGTYTAAVPSRFSPLRRTVRDSSIEESFRILRSNVEVALVNLEPPIAIVTSAYPGEGKTWTVVGLARALAGAGRRVVLVDLDLRKPGVHSALLIPNEIGVSDVLLGKRAKIPSAAQRHFELGDNSNHDALRVYDLGLSPVSRVQYLWALVKSAL